MDKHYGWSVILLAMTLTMLTWLAGDANFRARNLESLLPSDQYPGDPLHWGITGDAGGVGFSPDGILLTARDGQSVQTSLRIPVSRGPGDRSEPFRISGRLLRHFGPSLETEKRRQPIVYIEYLRDGLSLGYGAVTRSTGQYRNQPFEYLVLPPPGTQTIVVNWRVRTPGTWELKELELSTVRMNTHYALAACLLLLAWTGFLAWFLKPALLRARPIMLVSCCAIIGIIVLGTGLGQPTVQSIALPVMEILWPYLPENYLFSVQGILKFGHLMAFAGVSLSLLWLRHCTGLTVLRTLVLSLILAVASEAFQRHRFNRSPELTDVAIDAIGIALGALLFWFIVRVRRTAGQYSAATVRMGCEADSNPTH